MHCSLKGAFFKMVKIFILFIASIVAMPMATHAQFFEEGHLVTDVRNNIVWLRCSVGQRWDYDTGKCVGKVVKLNQQEIKDAIIQANQQLGGTWRLPTREELETLVCEDCGPPKIREKYFPTIEREAYWTGSQNYFNSKMYWSVNFMTGHSYSRFFAYQQLPVLLVKER
jgi:hypothetical protein